MVLYYGGPWIRWQIIPVVINPSSIGAMVYLSLWGVFPRNLTLPGPLSLVVSSFTHTPCYLYPLLALIFQPNELRINDFYTLLKLLWLSAFRFIPFAKKIRKKRIGIRLMLPYQFYVSKERNSIFSAFTHFINFCMRNFEIFSKNNKIKKSLDLGLHSVFHAISTWLWPSLLF